MLQQTTVATVERHFEAFIQKYPDISSLSKTSEEQITFAWQGLGYYRRARNLRKAAITINKNFSKKFPLDFNVLKSIPGVGDYTASALISIGGDKKHLAIDANIERVLSRIFLINQVKGNQLRKQIVKLFEEGKILKDSEKWGYRKLNEALMDLGRFFCRANKTDCNHCPVREDCLVVKKGMNPLDFPQVPSKIKKNNLKLTLLRIFAKNGNKILAYKKSDSEWLSGQIEIPTLILDSDDNGLTQYPRYRGRKKFKDLPEIKSTITKYKIRNIILETTPEEAKKLLVDGRRYRYYTVRCDSNHFSSATLKIFKLFHKNVGKN